MSLPTLIDIGLDPGVAKAVRPPDLGNLCKSQLQ
jgi:hypothetical protein